MGMGFRKSWWSVRRRRGQSGGPAGRKRIESRRDRERRKTRWQIECFCAAVIEIEIESGQRFWMSWEASEGRGRPGWGPQVPGCLRGAMREDKAKWALQKPNEPLQN